MQSIFAYFNILTVAFFCEKNIYYFLLYKFIIAVYSSAQMLDFIVCVTSLRLLNLGKYYLTLYIRMG